MSVKTFKSGGRLEGVGSYSRAKELGHLYMSPVQQQLSQVENYTHPMILMRNQYIYSEELKRL